jgi:hypothetical protein
MVQRGEFDTIYHEHYSFFTPSSVAALAERTGLRLVKTDIAAIHGGSFIFQLAHADVNDVTPIELSGEWVEPAEATRATTLLLTSNSAADLYSKFSSEATDRMAAARKLIADCRADFPESEIWLVGAAAKAITFARAADLDIDRIFDEAPEKIGSYVPGLPSVIEPLSDARADGANPLCIIAAWNFRNELCEKVAAIQGNNGVRYAVYFPQVECWSKDLTV